MIKGEERVESPLQGRHKGELVFVLGRGPSLSLAIPYKEELSKYVTIGVNTCFKVIELNYLIFADTDIWDTHRQEIRALQKTEVLVSATVAEARRLPYRTFRVHSPPRSDYMLSDDPKRLFWRFSTNHAAVNLAYLFGASEIALLGVDLNDHSRFDEGSNGKEFANGPAVIHYFGLLAKDLKAKGVKCWNCSPDSAVESWEKVELSKLLTTEMFGI